MQLLDAVNLVLPKLGERAVTSTTQQHPTLAILLPIMDQVRRTALTRGWWFNEFETTIYPDLNSELLLPSTTLSFVPHEYKAAIQRGFKLFNPETLNFVFTKEVQGTLVFDVPFEELPQSCADYVVYASVVEAYSTDIGVSNDLATWQTLSGRAWSDLLAEHLRNQKYSTKSTPQWAKLRHFMRGA